MVNMIFKQNILKEEKTKFLSIIIGVYVIPIAILIISIIEKENLHLLLMFLLLCVLPISGIIILLGLNNLEWFHIYEDRIEARCVFGIKNIVYFKNVLLVEELKINLTARGTPKDFYIFNDGRKNNNSLFDLNSCYNNKKLNLSIYKTAEIENFVNNILKLEVLREKQTD